MNYYGIVKSPDSLLLGVVDTYSGVLATVVVATTSY